LAIFVCAIPKMVTELDEMVFKVFGESLLHSLQFLIYVILSRFRV
jgi:hypothetical protein